MAKAFIFPGQGAQKLGMASAFVHGFQSGMLMMEEVEDAISVSLSKLIEEGPIEELTKTENAQPAIFATSMACVAILENEYGYEISRVAKYLAGHSLGEYTALCSAGVFAVSEASKLVRLRGELMASTCKDKENYSMVALLGVGVDALEELIEPYQTGRNICVIANDNSPQQVVISGHRKTVLAVSEKSKNYGVIKAIELNVSGPFHSPLMSHAAIEFDKVLMDVNFCNEFKVPVVMNVTAQPLTRKEDLCNYLVRQLTGRVRWRETIDFLMNSDDIDELIEVAPGRTLSSIIKRGYNNPKSIRTLETVSQIEECVSA